MRNYGASTVLEVANKAHCAYAFDCLHAHLHGLGDEEGGARPCAFPNTTTALFCTWNMRAGAGPAGSWRLRGCIGTLEPRPLHKALQDYALTSAVRDSRFAPIRAEDLPHLQCKVSLLSCFEQAASWDDWVVGTHGIIIEFTCPVQRCFRTATFLPDVPPEQGWDVQQTIDALIRKAGCDARPTDDLRASLHLVRYQSTICSMDHAEWLGARGGSEAKAGRGPEVELLVESR